MKYLLHILTMQDEIIQIRMHEIEEFITVADQPNLHFTKLIEVNNYFEITYLHFLIHF